MNSMLTYVKAIKTAELLFHVVGAVLAVSRFYAARMLSYLWPFLEAPPGKSRTVYGYLQLLDINLDVAESTPILVVQTISDMSIATLDAPMGILFDAMFPGDTGWWMT
jgi:hypothetical protein